MSPSCARNLTTPTGAPFDPGAGGEAVGEVAAAAFEGGFGAHVLDRLDQNRHIIDRRATGRRRVAAIAPAERVE